jgi:hypothetical protein
MTGRTYIDSRGWKYQVRPGLGGRPYKPMYQKPGQQGWHSVRHLPWRDTPEQAQLDLDEYAGKKVMKAL